MISNATFDDWPAGMDGLTESEREALARYDTATSGIPCALGEREPGTVDELRTLALLLRSWWLAIDTLDADLTAGSGELTLDGRIVLDHVLHVWALARNRLLLDVAAAVDISVPRPDGLGGEVETSNNCRGFIGHHDPELSHLLILDARASKAS